MDALVDLRDTLLAKAPIDVDHVKQVNKAEAEAWKRSESVFEADSTEILGFACGGQQWVHEVSIPCGTRAAPTLSDIDYMEKLLETIEKNQFPAHAPLEQRWTARSSSYMSPAYSDDEDEIFSWIGIIMYLSPDGNETAEEEFERRRQITERFQHYTRMHQDITAEHGGATHWAKLEVPLGDSKSNTQYRQKMIQRIRKRFPTIAFEKIRQFLDPRNILVSSSIDAIFSCCTDEDREF